MAKAQQGFAIVTSIVVSKHLNLSNPKPGHKTGGMVQGGGTVREGRAGQDADRTVRSGDKRPSTFQGNEETSPDLLARSTNKQNPSWTDGGTQRPFDEQFTRSLTRGRIALFVPVCWPVDRRFFLAVNILHARHVREFSNTHKVNRIRFIVCSLVCNQKQTHTKTGALFSQAFAKQSETVIVFNNLFRPLFTFEYISTLCWHRAKWIVYSCEFKQDPLVMNRATKSLPQMHYTRPRLTASIPPNTLLCDLK